MESISGGNFVDIATALVVYVLRSCDRGLQRVFIPKAMKSAKRIDLVFVYGVDDFAR